MIYIFDKTQTIIKVLTNDDFTAAHLNLKINTATTFEFSLPASKALPSDSKYVATPHPLDDSKFIMLRLTERVDNTETIDYSAYELAYQELATDGYIEDKRPQNQSALNLMKIALTDTNWELNNVNVSGSATTNFYYEDHLSAISNVVDLLGGEIVFYIEIQGNAISGRYMDYLARQGADTSKVFASGSNLLTVERQSDTSNIYTAILPRGKGEEIDNGDADTPDGYGRRINISDVEWKKSAGNPLDKPQGSIVLSDPDATAEWGQINGNARLLLQTYDDIDDVNVLINSAYKTLQSVNHPQIQYSATVADVGGLSLGDTVLIMHGDRDLSYKTRVFEVKYDLLAPDQTELSLGDDLSSNSITSQINSLNSVADTTSSQTQWTINQIGRPSTTFGNTEPANPKVGDIFFKELPDGGTEIYRWNGDIWELLVSPTTADDIAAGVTEAVAQANAHTDEVKQGLSTDIDTAKAQAKSQADTAQQNAITQAQTDAQNLVNDSSNTLNGKITTVQNNVDNLAGVVDSKVSQTTYDKNKQTTDTNISNLQQRADGFDLTVTKVNNLSIGGRNYLLNSDVSTTANITNFKSSKTISSFSGQKIVVSVQLDYDNITSISNQKRIGAEFTVVNATTNTNIYLGTWKNPIVGESFHGRIYQTFDFSSLKIKGYSSDDFTWGQGIYVQGVFGTNVSVSRPKIEIANLPTDYSVAPEDTSVSIAQVKITADGINNFVRDASGNISSDFQTALSKTSIITGSTLATSIQKQTATQITSALTDNNGKIISLINQDTSGVQIAGKNIVLNGDTTVTGAFKVSQANIANGAIGTAQIGDAAITSAKIANLDVSKITGDVTNFIKSNWNGTYGSTAITSTGMSVQTSSLLAEFVNNGMRLTSGGESVGGIGVQGLVGMPDNYQGLTFWLNGKAEYMGWAARDYGNETDNPTLKMAWYRGETKPSGAKTGFNFDDDVVFNKDIAVAGGTTQKLTMMTRNFNSNSYPWFGDNRGNAGISFGSSQLYLHSDGTYWNMTSVIKALSGLGAIKIPSKINSDGTVGSWYNVTI
ncbi:phage tail protein [Leuconostoc pseudomesenteroides]|uniref:phage tail spike protein n=1 Tax=Leuconostoc pseudomesenteroides TaxID=33968 RepID=UPI001B8CDF42|nr:phage tail spike protein [Leuconostoc pseudomesenteroides]MBS0957176.1 phage tail protein [Leuconostoc pseudomesenteroides]